MIYHIIRIPITIYKKILYFYGEYSITGILDSRVRLNFKIATHIKIDTYKYLPANLYYIIASFLYKRKYTA